MKRVRKSRGVGSTRATKPPLCFDERDCPLGARRSGPWVQCTIYQEGGRGSTVIVHDQVRTDPTADEFQSICALGRKMTDGSIRPEDVDYVFCTHLHHDHCGWSTQLRDGRFVPTFPKARYLYVRREYERWDTRRPDHKPVDYNVGVFERSVLPIVEAGLADLVIDTHRLSSSVSIEPSVKRNALIIPAHFPKPYAGWVRRNNGAVTFEALA
jgi:glyoxylase-like metal-dependent hydrolase (beta-lactamase superfamily II)